MINNIFKHNSRFFISYEIGVMIACIEDSPTNIDLVDSIQRICENVKLNPLFSANGYKDYYKENHLNFDLEEMKSAFYKYGLEIKGL